MKPSTSKSSAPVADDSAGSAPDRKLRIIRSAEALCARFGYHAVTIRQIADDAGVPLALVRYYYGAKDELFQAIFQRWNHVNEKRLALLAEALQDSAPPRLLRRIVQAFALPVLALRDSEEGMNYAVFLARELANPSEESQRACQAFLDPLARAFLDGLQQALPHASREQVAWCYQFILGALMAHMQECLRGRVLGLAGGSAARGTVDSGQMVIDFIVGGVNAAVPRPGKS